MTTTPSRAPTAAAEPGASSGTGRVLLGVTTALGPFLLALGVGILPYATGGAEKEIVRDIAADRTLTEVTLWCWLSGSIALVVGALAVGLLAMRASPKLGLWGLVLFGTGLLAIASTPEMDAVALGGLAEGVSQDALAKAGEGTYELLVVAVPILYFVVAHVVGAILLGVALLRGRVIAPWAAWLLILSMPLNVVGYAGGIMPLTVVSFVMMGVAFALAGLVVVRYGTGWVRATG
ncbi:hypothetical protein STRCI_005106 [Streptomyces cinnabarinus]|uniref:DUF4386 family protein n=1 Tax=Streptomyces cinnabarinus TaxID=67287 RepID=A0ABY7KK03_9ACTN|nr:hypothetical protein [Streptomyces cinnabarinus]WAZ23742.1 hypothetical protein STRCI_005106 [Streptomyces cinnabarinus]